MLRTLRSLDGLLCKPMRKIKFFLLFHFNGAPVDWNWQGKTEVLGENPIPVPLFPPQTTNWPTRDRNRASAVRGQRLTAWAMAQSFFGLSNSLIPFHSNRALLWRLNVGRSNRTYLGLHAKRSIFLPDFNQICIISTDEICGLLGYYTASCGNYLPTFRDNVSVPSSRVKIPSRKESL
jgi:hypothetical protein